jgi:large subunit ribosomal protein L22
MEAQAVTKYLRVSPFKAREVVRLIQGKPAAEALSTVSLIPRKAARMVAKTLKSAIANAENNESSSASASDLVVTKAVVEEGPTMRRFRTKARGMAGRIRKRTSHIRIVVSDVS